VAQNLEHIVDVRVLAEFQNDRLLAAFDPNIDLRIEVEVACGFLREVVDALVGNARVLALLAGHALLVHEEEAVIRENDQVAKELVGVLNRLAINQEVGEFLFELGGIDLARIPK